MPTPKVVCYFPLTKRGTSCSTKMKKRKKQLILNVFGRDYQNPIEANTKNQFVEESSLSCQFAFKLKN